MHSARDIIDAFGGATRLAEALAGRFPALRPSRASVYMWKSRGIPGRWHAPLLELAREQGVALTPAHLVGGSASSAEAA